MLPKKLRIDKDKRELPVGLSPGFPMTVLINRFSAFSYGFIDWHWHDELQYCLVLSGSVLFLVDGRRVAISEGSGIFINTQRLHRIEPENDGASYLCIYFSAGLISENIKGFLYSRYLSPVLADPTLAFIVLDKEDGKAGKILDSLLEIRRLRENPSPGVELDICSQVILIWKDTLQCLPERSGEKTTYENSERLKKILRFIHAHYADRISLGDIAALIGLSRGECCRFFQKTVGQPLFRYLMAYRINKSIDLLLGTDKGVAEIAYETGFNSQSYFTKCFKALKNVTPSRLRLEYGAQVDTPDPEDIACRGRTGPPEGACRTEDLRSSQEEPSTRAYNAASE